MKAEFQLDNGNLATCDVINHDNKLWLVVSWLDFHEQKISKPLRIIRFDTLAYQKLTNNECSYLINEAIPSFLFEPKALTKKSDSFEVIETPDISIPIQDKSLN